MKFTRRLCTAAAAVGLATSFAVRVSAQLVADPGFKSVGRGAPVAAALPALTLPLGPRAANADPAEMQRAMEALNRFPFVGPFAFGPMRAVAASDGAVPSGVQALPVDLFTSKDFYTDRALWTDKRYFRCNSPQGLEMQRGAILAADRSATIRRALLRGVIAIATIRAKRIVSPYKFKTAQEHYEALLAETKKRGGPTQHTYATVPGELNGRYAPGGFIRQLVFVDARGAVPDRAVGAHAGVPEALRPGHVPPGQHQRAAVAVAVLLAGGIHAALVLRRDPVPADRHRDAVARADRGGRRRQLRHEHPHRPHVQHGGRREAACLAWAPAVPRWYGETIGFWDKDALITWTSNIQGWAGHGVFEFSSKLQTIEIYTPMRDKAGKVTALNHESVFYDPEAFVEPIRIVRNYQRLSGFEEGDPPPFIECIATIYPIKGHSTPVSPGAVIEYEVPDMYRAAVGTDVGEVLRAGHEEARGEGHLRLQQVSHDHTPKWKPEAAFRSACGSRVAPRRSSRR